MDKNHSELLPAAGSNIRIFLYGQNRCWARQKEYRGSESERQVRSIDESSGHTKINHCKLKWKSFIL
jgi:hypothetical protein